MWKIRNKINELQKRNEIPKYQKVKVKNETNYPLFIRIVESLQEKNYTTIINAIIVMGKLN